MARSEEAERCRLAALNCHPESGAENRARQIRYLEAATQFVPDDALLRLDLASAYQDACFARLKELPEGRPSADERAGAYREQATRHFLRARDLCPLLSEPHMRLAGAAPLFKRADAPHVYLERALFVNPNDARVWFVAGVQDFDDGHRDQALEKWRRSLECSDLHLPDILSRSSRFLPPQEVVSRILPDRPALLYAAGQSAAAKGMDGVPEPCYRKALALLERQPVLDADELRLKGRLHRAVGEVGPAIQAYEAAVAVKSDATWLFDLAALLYEQERLPEAERYLQTVLALSPGHTAALELQEKILRRTGDSPLPYPN